VIRKTGHATEKMEVRAEPLKRSNCNRVTSSAHGWKSRGLACPGDEFSMSGREAATLLACLGIPAVCKAGDTRKGSRPSIVVIPRPKPFRWVSPQGECRSQRRAKAELHQAWEARIREALGRMRGEDMEADKKRRAVPLGVVRRPVRVEGPALWAKEREEFRVRHEAEMAKLREMAAERNRGGRGARGGNRRGRRGPA